MTCKSCTHAQSRPSIRAGEVVLWCARYLTVPQRVCGDFERYPGAEND
jgi:hypothetical protein